MASDKDKLLESTKKEFKRVDCNTLTRSSLWLLTFLLEVLFLCRFLLRRVSLFGLWGWSVILTSDEEAISPAHDVDKVGIAMTITSDSGRSKFLLKSAGPSHHQTSVSRHQNKAFGELYSTVMVGGCDIKSIRKLRPFPIFPIQISIERNYKSARRVLNQFTR